VVPIPELLLRGLSIESSRRWSRDLIDYDRQPILLCARVLSHCFSQGQGSSSSTTTTPTTPTSRLDTWTELFNSLSLWYSNRPHDFKPVVELHHNPSGLFPVMLFTNSAAILANQLYHTAMLLMLQHRPRTIRPPNASPLRHAQMVCGISLSNDCAGDNANSWDFCLVASLYLAARGMTYTAQQEAICAKLESIRAKTSWNIASLTTRLRETWHPS
jgi:hypothetical protein